MQSYTNLIFYTVVVLLLVQPLNATGQQSLDQLKNELERKKVEQQLAEAEQKRLEAEKAAKQVKKDIEDADKPVEKTAKELAEERKAISEADAASLKAKKEMLASPFTGSLSTGSTSATGTFPETNILNQESLALMLSAMIKDINVSAAGDKKELKLVIYNATDFSGLTSYASLLDQFDQFNNVFTKVITDAKRMLNPPDKKDTLTGAGLGAALLAPTVVNSIAQTVGGLIQLFRTDISFTNSDIPVDDFNLTSLMVSAIRNAQMPWKVFYPAIYPIDVVKRIDVKASQLQQKISELDAQSAKAKVELTNVEKKIKELSDKTAKKQAGKEVKLTNAENTLLSNLTTVKASLQTIEKAYSDVLTSLNTVDPTAKLTPFIMMARIERLSNVLTQKDVYVVKMTATATGSQKLMKSNVRRARIEHSAGAILSYEVFSPTGEIVCGAGIYNYSPYQESGNIARKSSIPTEFKAPARLGSGEAEAKQPVTNSDKK